MTAEAMLHADAARLVVGRGTARLSTNAKVPEIGAELRSEPDLPGCPQVWLGLGRPQEPLPPPAVRLSVADVLTH
jgi:hypothetical protein